MIGIIIVTGISVSSLILNQNQPAVAQQQQPRQQQEQALASKDISFDINNVTFSHHYDKLTIWQLPFSSDVMKLSTSTQEQLVRIV